MSRQDQPADPALSHTASVLSRASFEKGISKSLVRVSYPDALDPDRLQFPEPLLSLYHHPVYRTLSDEQRWRLSLLETVNFFSINIHGERSLVRDLVLRCHRSSALGNSPVVHEYLQHFIHEENAHTFMLAGYCYRYGEGVLKDPGLALPEAPRSPAGEELLCFGRTWMLESFLDHLNREAMRDDALDPTARQIHRVHHLDEARHMAFDKAVLRACVDQLKAEGRQEEMQAIAAQLTGYGQHALRRLSNAAIYRAIGLPQPMQLVWDLEASPERRAVEETWISGGTAFLTSLGLVPTPAADS
jgi:hypothetical protein